MQCEREIQYNLVSQMMAMTVSPVQAMGRNTCHTQGTATAQVQQDMEVHNFVLVIYKCMWLLPGSYKPCLHSVHDGKDNVRRK